MSSQGAVAGLREMLAGMKPCLFEDHGWQFVESSNEKVGQAPFAIINEAEGTTDVVPYDEAEEVPVFARITLEVHSSLEGVGLTAQVAGVLADAGIACNVIAGFYHDHLFVPWDSRDDALGLLEQLSKDARR